ncbi:MAG: ABC transporter substrate-binding protein, partial [Paenibacillaceae bacterium]|nr:ABC transporter substrate-binding protein [Paenibacillaceae bacterium]
MRKFSAVLMCLMLLGSLLAACGGGNNKEAQNNGGNGGGNAAATGNNGGGNAEPAAGEADDITQRKVTIKIHYPLPDETTLRQQEDDKIARFQAKYPNVTIVKDDWQYSVNEIGVKMASNEAPTFYNTWATEAQFLVERGWVADITELWNNWEYKDEINPVLQNQFIVDGKVYGI